mmetsp:Transcript_33836/g.110716  ORF Transcript_33836/g.110716 Transcript_33836/m.110716 type:complete len:211 (-) Transcript_33836:257-889(-)
MSWRSTRCRTTPLPSCTRSTERTCGTRTRRSPPCASCTTAPTTRSWMCSSSMASSHRPTSRPRIGAPSPAARGFAPRCCHMFGLGIYLADLSQKSHRYCSQPELLPNGRRRFRMVLCSVLGRALEVAGHLKYKEAMHDVCNVRAVGDELKDMIEPHCCSVPSKHAVEGADLLAVKGLGGAVRPGYSVVNSEYIAYHPYQCLPKYQITYEV